MRARWLVLALVSVGVAAPATARANDGVDRETQAKADLLFEKAQAHFQANEFQAALELFQNAYDLVHDPVYLFNIAQSYRKVLDCTAAYDYYARYLDAAKTATNRAKVEAWMRELQPCVDQRKAEREAAARGAELDRQHKAEEAERLRIAMLPHTRVVDHGRSWRIGGMALGGAGALGLAIGIGDGIHSATLKSEAAKACPGGCNWNDVKSLDAAGARANTIATIGYVGGGLAAIAGAGLYFFGRARIEVVQITPQPGGGVVSARLSF